MAVVKTVLGLMSGTSLDGIDLALLRTDGETLIDVQRDGFVAYDAATSSLLRGVLDAAIDWPTDRLQQASSWPEELHVAAQAVTEAHCRAASDFLDGATPDLVGFHGQTITHRPSAAMTLQIGDGQELADYLKCNVVAAFRLADMAAGGEGAPLAPLYHAALAGPARPQAMLNLGGVGNLTWLGEADAIMAFDTGPGNALVDDWVQAQTGDAYDADGALAASGQVHEDIVATLMAHPYFDAAPPKSLDRLSFSVDAAQGLAAADGAATLTAFTAESVARALALCPQKPVRLILCGGGRHNKTLCRMIAARGDIGIVDCDMIGWQGDSLEAQAFAWLAMRSLRGLPLSLPTTTGVLQPITGGELFEA